MAQYLALRHVRLRLVAHLVLLVHSHHAGHAPLHAGHHAWVAGPSRHHFVHLWVAGRSVRRL